MKSLKVLSVVTTCGFTLLSSSAVQAFSITNQQRNIVPAIASFDYAVAALGLGYGIDTSFPNQTVNGLITDTGFNWTASGTYLGQSFQWSALGTYNTQTNSLFWSGGGNYDSSTWSLSGNINWTSETDFLISHLTNIEINGISNTDTTVGQDPGNVNSFNGSSIDYTIEHSSHKFLGFLWKINDGIDNVKVTVEGGKIIENKLTIKNPKTNVGVSVILQGGAITIDGGGFHKETKIEPVPEPSTIFGTVTALAALPAFIRKYAKLKKLTNKV